MVSLFLILGTYYYKGGMKYIGEFLDGQKHGRGIYYDANGNSYEGKWEYGQMNGRGRSSLEFLQVK